MTMYFALVLSTTSSADTFVMSIIAWSSRVSHFLVEVMNVHAVDAIRQHRTAGSILIVSCQVFRVVSFIEEVGDIFELILRGFSLRYR